MKKIRQKEKEKVNTVPISNTRTISYKEKTASVTTIDGISGQLSQ
jgi:hypothetical protein